MRITLIIVLFIFTLNAGNKGEVYRLYENSEFRNACEIAKNIFPSYKKDEKFLSLYAFSCLYSDNIDNLADPIALLGDTKNSRANASYLSIIVMQKKLLYHSLLDQYPLDTYKFPTTDYVLSTVFDLYTNKTDKSVKSVYSFTSKSNPKVSYKLYLSKKHNFKKMVIEEYYDRMLLKRHIYN